MPPLAESGRLEFDEFVTLAAKFIVEEDAEALEKELREAFRLYDKEGMANLSRARINNLSDKRQLTRFTFFFREDVANNCLNNSDYFL